MNMNLPFWGISWTHRQSNDKQLTMARNNLFAQMTFGVVFLWEDSLIFPHMATQVLLVGNPYPKAP